MFTQIYIFISLSFLLCFSCYGYAFSSGDEGSSLKKRNSKTPKSGESHMGIQESVYNVKNYGAKGDGTTDDTKAFEAAFAATCGNNNGTMLVPSGYTFLLQPIIFNGNNCQAKITFQIEGNIVAPSKMSKWKNVGTQWILFRGFSEGLTIIGHGVVDGRGQDWWENVQSSGKSANLRLHKNLSKLTKKNYPKDKYGFKNDKQRPSAIEIDSSNHVNVTGITIQNSPQMHIYFYQCQYVTISNITVSSPGDSPNTDGIHLSKTQHVNIYHSNLACGDDCVSIQSGCSDVTIQNVHCGPGHGYSIGSLGYGGEKAEVSGIGVYNSKAVSTSNGVRIKTWEGATGSVKNVTFKNIIMSNVDNPILIDQYYCNGADFCKPSGKSNAVAISGVHFKNITGTYTKRAVSIVCSGKNPCKGITVDTIYLIYTYSIKKRNEKDAALYCSNAYGQVLTKTTPSFQNCLKSG